jgi:ATP synthase F1 gamma subunit
MITKKALESEIENLEGLNNMVKAYEEIAASRIVHSRDQVLTNRMFIDEISLIFSLVIVSYKKRIGELLKEKKVKNVNELTFLQKNGKTLNLLISANTGLYGSLVRRTFDLFLENSKNSGADKAIIGKLGLSMWQQTKIKDKFYYFDFPDQHVDKNQLKQILDFLISYEKVIIFYGRFQNLITQDATSSDVSGNIFTDTKEPEKIVKYVFEPSLERIMEFFEKELFASIFEQTMRESQLAKIASRLTTLDNASENILKQLNVMRNENNITTHRQINKKQLETFSSRTLWGNI